MTQLKNFFKNLIEDSKKKVQFYKDTLHEFIVRYKITKFAYEKALLFRQKMVESTLFFSVVILWSSFSFSIIRWIQTKIVFGDMAFAWRAYYISVGLSFLFSFGLIIFNFILKNGYFSRLFENGQKWREFEKIVSESNGISIYRFYLTRFVFIVIANSLFKPFISFPHPWGSFFIGLQVVLIVLFLANFFYIWRLIMRTPVPDNLLLEPPKIYYAIDAKFGKLLFGQRSYSTKPGRWQQTKIFYTNHKKKIWVLSVGIGAVASSALNTDAQLALQTSATSCNEKISDLGYHGVYTNDPKVRRRMWSLVRYKNIDPKDLVYYGTKELNPEAVHTAYESQIWSENKREYKRYKETIKTLETTVLQQEDKIMQQQDNIIRQQDEIIQQDYKIRILEERLNRLEEQAKREQDKIS